MRSLLSFLLLAGGCLLLFLGAREWFEARYRQSVAARDFETGVESRAEAPPAPAPASIPAPMAAPRRGDVFARLSIPRLGTTLYVVQGAGSRELRRGPGHLAGTAMPGGRGNCVIAGHRDTHFRVLKGIRRGDEIVLQTSAGTFRYRVKSTRIVSPQDTSALQPASSAELTLVTCYPFYYVGPAPRRFVAVARLVSETSS